MQERCAALRSRMQTYGLIIRGVVPFTGEEDGVGSSLHQRKRMRSVRSSGVGIILIPSLFAFENRD
jgi:hypothetical protein